MLFIAIFKSENAQAPRHGAGCGRGDLSKLAACRSAEGSFGSLSVTPFARALVI